MEFSGGVYQGKFESAEACVNKKNTSFVACVFSVVAKAGTDPAGQPAWIPFPEVVERTMYLYTSKAALSFTFDKLKALGFDGNFDVDQLKFAKIGELVRLECRLEEYEGKTRDKWDLYRGKIESTPLPKTEKVKLNAAWQALSQSAPTPAPVAQVASSTMPVVGPSDDDIPFLDAPT